MIWDLHISETMAALMFNFFQRFTLEVYASSRIGFELTSLIMGWKVRIHISKMLIIFIFIFALNYLSVVKHSRITSYIICIFGISTLKMC
jgi:hypothetical protein